MVRRKPVPRRSAFAPLVVASVTLCVAVCASSGVQDAPPPTPKPADEAARKLFVANCAPCHGETGDGHGTTVLERPARSFKDGGFSYGNTPEAILRTITFGIPGSLMPNFATGLKDEERKALAQYVIALGPPQLAVDASETRMVVHDVPLIVRGKLPPIVAGAPERPRGLLIGTPDGLTFEYRTDDVRLLGVRSGEFVDRRDWIGRGGDALQPLGKLVRAEHGGGPVSVEHGGDPPPTFELLDTNTVLADRRTAARLVSTSVVSGVPRIIYDLIEVGVDREHERIARITETLGAYRCKLGTGWKRDFVVEVLQTGGFLRVVTAPGTNSLGGGYVSAFDGFPRAMRIVELADTKLCDLVAWRLGPEALDPGRTEWKATTHLGIEGRLKAGERHVFSVLCVPGVSLPPGDAEQMGLIGPMFEESR